MAQVGKDYIFDDCIIYQHILKTKHKYNKGSRSRESENLKVSVSDEHFCQCVPPRVADRDAYASKINKSHTVSIQISTHILQDSKRHMANVIFKCLNILIGTGSDQQFHEPVHLCFPGE